MLDGAGAGAEAGAGADARWLMPLDTGSSVCSAGGLFPGVTGLGSNLSNKVVQKDDSACDSH